MAPFVIYVPRETVMTRTTRLLAGMLVLSAGAACSAGRTERPVASDAAGNTSVSPSGTQAAAEGKSMVRLVNAIPTGPTINVMGDDRTLFTGVSYKTVTPYLEVTDNHVKFKLSPSSADTAIAANSEMMRDGGRYTIVALPDDNGGARLRILTDNVVPDSGKAKVRVINAASGAKNVDVALQGQKDPLFKGVGYGSEAGYQEITPVTATVEIRRNNPDAHPVLIKNMHFEAGKSYSIVLSGSRSGSVEVITIEDGQTGSALSTR